MKIVRWLLGGALALAALSAAASKPHVHGAGTLDVAVEGGRITLALEAPLEDLVGFERPPRNDSERAALEAMKAFFASDAAFAPNSAAGCRRTGTKVELRDMGKGHATVEGAFDFRCDDPRALLHVDVGLFARFPKLRRIDARIVSDKGQSASRLTPKGARLRL